MKLFVLMLGTGALCAFAAGCNSEDTSNSGADETATRGTVDQTLVAEIDGKFNTYAQAVLDNDVELLNVLVSDEVKTRVKEKNSDMAGFAAKMRDSFETEFSSTAGDGSTQHHFAVESVTWEGDALRVTVAKDGVALSKPFYYVSEGGDYKLNLLRPGFTKPLPEGAGASTDTYLVQWPYGVPSDIQYKTISCNGGRSVSIANGETRSIACNSNCGWWTGASFYRAGVTKKCDWNTWGVDVYMDAGQSGGFRCNDGC